MTSTRRCDYPTCAIPPTFTASGSPLALAGDPDAPPTAFACTDHLAHVLATDVVRKDNPARAWVVRLAQDARCQKPEPRTERVPAVDALGRDVVSDKGSAVPTFIGFTIIRRVAGGLLIESFDAGSRQRIAPDSKVEVLVKDEGDGA